MPGVLALQSRGPRYPADAPPFPDEFVNFILRTMNPFFKHLILAGMLVNTNNAFTGINAMELDDLKAGQIRVVYTYALDAGTEAKSELVGTIPGITCLNHSYVEWSRLHFPLKCRHFPK